MKNNYNSIPSFPTPVGIAKNNEPTPQAPVWIRPPLPGRLCPYTSMRRGLFYARLCGNPRIRQLHMGGAGKKRGCRLLLLEDVHAELLNCAAAQLEGNQ
jgi:hypothetical protein